MKANRGTKTRILDAAEQIFASVGFEAASVRQIVSAAGVNLAAIHYHFGSKEALIEAVFSRRINPLNQERLALLDQIEADGGHHLFPVETLVAAFIGPALRLARDPSRGGPVVMRLFGRTIAEPSPFLQAVIREQFASVLNRFVAALQRALPHLPKAVLYWRMQFLIGSMAHIMCDPAKAKRISGGLCDPADTEEVARQIVAFVSAGLRAPVPA